MGFRFVSATFFALESIELPEIDVDDQFINVAEDEQFDLSLHLRAIWLNFGLRIDRESLLDALQLVDNIDQKEFHSTAEIIDKNVSSSDMEISWHISIASLLLSKIQLILSLDLKERNILSFLCECIQHLYRAKLWNALQTVCSLAQR